MIHIFHPSKYPRSATLPFFDDEKTTIAERFLRFVQMPKSFIRRPLLAPFFIRSDVEQLYCKITHTLAVSLFLMMKKQRYASKTRAGIPPKGAYHEYLRKKNVFSSGEIEF